MTPDRGYGAGALALALADIGACKLAPWAAETASMEKARKSRSTDRNRLVSAIHRPASVPLSGASRATNFSILIARTASDDDGTAAKLATVSRLPSSAVSSFGHASASSPAASAAVTARPAGKSRMSAMVGVRSREDSLVFAKRLGLGIGGLGFRCIQPVGTDRTRAPPRGDALLGIAGRETRREPQPQAKSMSEAASLVTCARKTLSPAAS
jgi:hypothetical protein